MSGKLESDAALKAELDAILVGDATAPVVEKWAKNLATFLDDVRSASATRLRDPLFLKKLWDENPVAATGMGSVKIAPALADDEFREWFAAEIAKPLPLDPNEAEARLTHLYNELGGRLQSLCDRTPWLKINRVLCAFFSSRFTSIANVGALLSLHKDLGGSTKDHPVRAHIAIRRRIDAVLGPLNANDPIDEVRRICIPWLLHDRLEQGTSAVVSVPSLSSELKPQPATLRRKGLTPLKGNFQTLLGYLPDLADGMSRDEFVAVIRQGNPDLADNSVGTIINVVAKEFGLSKLDGTTYRLTARGINLLESQDPDELADHLLTRILGVDFLISALAEGSKDRGEVLSLLQTVNPGWTTTFIPAGMINWLTSLDVVRMDASRKIALTERGRRWVELVTWTPQQLPSSIEGPQQVQSGVGEPTVSDPKSTGFWHRIQDRAADAQLSFAPALVRELHSGLWCHPRRHFAVLTGLSGSGKTQLADLYARALCDVGKDDTARVRIIPVQPGWYDPSPLLGYVNPIQDSSYRSAPFLELLLSAASDPQRPYVAILDEMNLSHPEQYLAPVLSAMETQGSLDLHQISEDLCPVPRQVAYPVNLAIIGTVNMDETTHGLSDKVLDRAHTIEFWDIRVEDFPGWQTVDLEPVLIEKTKAVLTQLSEALAPARLHFGWRTVNDVLCYLRFHTELAAGDDSPLDDVIFAKVLPKLRGEDSPRFQEALRLAHATLKEHGLVRCERKVASLQDDLSMTGAARFWR